MSLGFVASILGHIFHRSPNVSKSRSVFQSWNCRKPALSKARIRCSSSESSLESSSYVSKKHSDSKQQEHISALDYTIAKLGNNQKSIRDAVELLKSTGLFQVVAKHIPRSQFHPDDGADKQLLLVLDVETTGLKPGFDHVIEIGYMLIEFSPETGKLYQVIDRGNELQDPGEPLSDIITSLTGITNADIQGKSFDRTKIESMISRSSLVMAHNAWFERSFLEPQFSELIGKNWVCSMVHGPWDRMHVGKKQEYLSYMVGGFFYDAHRALPDVEALVEIVHTNGPNDQPILKDILTTGMQPSHHLWATGAPYESKDFLKEKGYKWSDGSANGSLKCWHKDNVVDINLELEFLAAEVYKKDFQVCVDVTRPTDVFTNRYSERKTCSVMLRKNAK